MEALQGLTILARWGDMNDIPTSSFQQSMIIVVVLVEVLAFTTYSLRMYSKYFSKQLGLDDWLMTAAMVISLADIVPTLLYFRYGYVGLPSSEIPVTNDPTTTKLLVFITGLLYNPMLAFVKASGLVFMLRIAGHKTEIMWSIYVLNTFNLSLMVAIFLVVLFQTTPIAAYWDSSLVVERSIDAGSFAISTAIFTIITDVLVLAIPLWVFAGLNMNTATKVGLILVFLTGGFVTLLGILRVVAFRHFFFDPGYDFGNSWGPTYSIIEPNVAIICGCIPPIRPLLRKWLPMMFSQAHSKETDGPYLDDNGYGARKSAAGGTFELKEMGRNHTEIRSHSPRGSEEEIMTPNGIVRTTMVDISYGSKTMVGRYSSDTGGMEKPHSQEPGVVF